MNEHAFLTGSSGAVGTVLQGRDGPPTEADRILEALMLEEKRTHEIAERLDNFCGRWSGVAPAAAASPQPPQPVVASVSGRIDALLANIANNNERITHALRRIEAIA